MSCTKEISKPLAHIYNLSFSSGIIPEKLKIAVGDGSVVTLERVGLVVGIAVGLGSLYFMWCSRQEKDEKPEESKIVEEPKPVVITPKGPDLFD
jgi:hypothetical protein